MMTTICRQYSGKKAMRDKYLLFSGDKYYPLGGFNDFRLAGTFKECAEHFQNNPELRDSAGFVEGLNTWAHIVDRDTLKIVAYGKRKDSDDQAIWEMVDG
jgi:hypothetical protein